MGAMGAMGAQRCDPFKAGRTNDFQATHDNRAWQSALGIALGCHFFDAGEVTTVSKVDGVHLDADQHHALGRAIAPPVGALL